MKTLYHADRFNTAFLRDKKTAFLECFKRDGFYLIDACEDPMECTSRSYKRNRIEADLLALRKEVSTIVEDDTRVILISSSVYETIESSLNEFDVVNEGVIPFPGSGQQRKYRSIMRLQLQEIGWVIRKCCP
jgi:vacuolar-type H+-ATPase subunit F/Vma7